MQEGGFYRFCISACIFMILIGMAINVVLMMNIFPTHMESPIVNQTTGNVTTIAGGDIISLFAGNVINLIVESFAIAGGFLLALIIAMRTGSWNIVAAYLFGTVFWVSWQGSLRLFAIGGYFDSPVMAAILLMITVVMVFIFAGATIGILGGTD